MNYKPLKKKYSITLDPDVAEGIKQAADADDRSFSQYINMLLRESLTKWNTETGNPDIHSIKTDNE